MADSTRAYQFKRREKAIADLSGVSPTNGRYSLADLRNTAHWKINSIHQIGIATANEVGLEYERWPIRVKIAPAADHNPATETVIHYWPLKTAAGQPVAFEQKANFDTSIINRLYKYYPDLDKAGWENWSYVKSRVIATAHTPQMLITCKAAITALAVPIPTAEQIVAISTAVNAMFAECRGGNRIARLYISNNHYIEFKPHGVMPVDHGTLIANHIPQAEAALCILVNSERMKGRTAGLDSGVYTVCAYAVANMFRFGLYEQFAGEEYYTVYFNSVDGVKYTVSSVTKPPHAPDIVDMELGKEFNLEPVRIDTNLIEISSALVATAGTMHYSHNHTTGGNVIAGPLLSIASSFGFISSSQDMAVQENITRVFYEALHPVNKRHIANLFFKNSKVFTAGRHADAMIMAQFTHDSFMMIRNNPYPAGAHKAYIAGEVVKRILASRLAPFLPWAGEMGNLVGACVEIAERGARAHIGSRYYTGDSPINQGATIDSYMGDLAAYIQIMCKNDTLGLSPHLGVAVSAGADKNWTALLKKIKADDISGTDVEVVKKYLLTAGRVTFSLDPNDETTWGKSIAEGDEYLGTLREMI